MWFHSCAQQLLVQLLCVCMRNFCGQRNIVCLMECIEFVLVYYLMKNVYWIEYKVNRMECLLCLTLRLMQIRSYLWWTFMIESGTHSIKMMVKLKENDWWSEWKGQNANAFIVQIVYVSRNVVLFELHDLSVSSLWWWCMWCDVIIKAYAWVKVLMGVIIFWKKKLYLLSPVRHYRHCHCHCHCLEHWLPCTKYINSHINILWFR